MGSALFALKEWQEIRVPSRKIVVPSCKNWHVPSHGFVKCNVDGGFFEDSMETGIGMVLRDEVGEFIACRTVVHTGLMGVDEGEAWGVIDAIKWVIRLALKKLSSKLTRSMLQRRTSVVKEEIRRLKITLRRGGVSFIPVLISQ